MLNSDVIRLVSTQKYMQLAKLSVYCIIEARDVSVFTNLEIDATVFLANSKIEF